MAAQGPRDLWSKPGNPAPDGLIGDFNSQLGHPEQNSAPGGVGAHYGHEKTSSVTLSLFPVESLPTPLHAAYTVHERGIVHELIWIKGVLSPSGIGSGVCPREP